MHTLWKDLPTELKGVELADAIKNAALDMKIGYYRLKKEYSANGYKYDHNLVALILNPFDRFEQLVSRINQNYIIEVVSSPIKDCQDKIGFDIYRGDRHRLLPAHRSSKEVRYLPIEPNSQTGLKVQGILDIVISKISSRYQ
jgi:hypothetical protein